MLRPAAVLVFFALSGCMVAAQPKPASQPAYATQPPEYQPPPPEQTPPDQAGPPSPQPTYAPPRHLHAIRVVAGSYGQNCRAAHGNTTLHLQQTCDGQPVCAYRVDYRIIGDPAYGCQKDYVAEWRCGSDPTLRRAAAAPEAGYGSVVQLSCGAGSAVVVAPPPPPVVVAPPPPPPPSRRSRTIRVVSGSYGQNCRAAHGNVTAHLQQLCEGHSSCTYRVDYKVIGDPAVGCRKDYVAEWRCGDDLLIRRVTGAPEAGFGSTIELRCD